MSSDIQPVALCQQVLDSVEHVVIGKRPVLEDMLCAFLAGGHVLLEDNPGVAKTLIAKSFSTALGLDFSRVQFTPDLLPTDITGGYVFSRRKDDFELRQGPVFCNILLADEINRASPKTQSALLEAMAEKQITLEGETCALPKPFWVLATQNPIEYESTFPLPEAQMDRFLLKLAVGYPELDQEVELLSARIERQTEQATAPVVLDLAQARALQAATERVQIAPELQQYIVKLVRNTREHRQVAIGASPRGSLALLGLARARALLCGRNFVLPDDIKHFAVSALAHRLVLKPEFWMKANAAEDVIQQVIGQTSVPVFESAEQAA